MRNRIEISASDQAGSAKPDARHAAQAFIEEVCALPSLYTPHIRAVRRARSRDWKAASPKFVTAVALALVTNREHRWERWFAYELVRFHKGAFQALDDRTLVRFAKGLDSWDSVDAFGRILSGPAWAQGLASDRLIEGWSRSRDLWLRRLALVSTVALNMKSDGGRGDTRRTLAVCARLVDDDEDMVVKALSWALRVLSSHDAPAVRAFLHKHDARLAARIKRETANKLRTGKKNPKATDGGRGDER
ncbi:MAG TPA: DNA alkylation repair protein [Rhizomicrobium sp.]|nr:DNA alkylation repair protein [Rhizomicrobium sp.]